MLLEDYQGTLQDLDNVNILDQTMCSFCQGMEMSKGC
jgi:hypothetical protein